MKYVLAGLAILAAVAALFFRPPHGESGDRSSPSVPRGSLGVGDPLDGRGSEVVSGVNGRVGATVGRTHVTTARSATVLRIVVYVAGEVNRPGVYAFASGSRAQDALARAGGAKPDADLVAVNLAAPLGDGTEIAVPKIGAPPIRGRHPTTAPAGRPSRQHGHGRRRRTMPEAAPALDVDLNSADESELETLPGIGPALAARIVEYRESNGPFTSVDELADVSGITPGLQDRLAGLIVIR